MDSIINGILETLIKAENPNDDNIIKTIEQKQNCLKGISIKYKDIKKSSSRMIYIIEKSFLIFI